MECCHGKPNCSGKGEKHWCDINEEDFIKMHTAVHGDPSNLHLPRDREAMRLEALNLVVICAQDIVNAWPDMTMRTLADMTKRMDTLRQALEAANK
jgi:hypothetical protein